MKEELYKKLAEWAGIKLNHDGSFSEDKANSRCFLADPFSSLDFCFKWLVPLIIGKIMVEQGCSSDVALAILFKKWLQELELNMTQPATTLCLAIKKLGDGVTI